MHKFVLKEDMMSKKIFNSLRQETLESMKNNEKYEEWQFGNNENLKYFLNLFLKYETMNLEERLKYIDEMKCIMSEMEGDSYNDKEIMEACFKKLYSSAKFCKERGKLMTALH